jgi:multiple sugar transport system permease protein
MTDTSYKYEKTERSLMERWFEAPAIGKMSTASKIVAYTLLVFWSLFVLFPIYWVVITAFKNGQLVNEGPFYIPFVDFQPVLEGWRFQFTSDPNCDLPSVGRQLVLYVWNSLAFLGNTPAYLWNSLPFGTGASQLGTIGYMEPQICKVLLAYSNSFVVSIAATALCMVVGSMAAYALARIQYKPKFGNIIMFVALTLAAIIASTYAGLHWAISAAIALALFFLLARSLGKHFKNTLGNGDILFWIISQRILPPIVVIIPVYMMFQAVGMLDTQMALILTYAVANLPIVVWLMHDYFANLPIELEESAQLDGATRFGIFWDIVLPLTRPGFAATTLLTLILNWNEYLFAVFLSTSKSQTMPIMIAGKNAGERGILWWEMCAIIMVMIIPVIIMAIFLQRFIAKGVLLGAVKG